MCVSAAAVVSTPAAALKLYKFSFCMMHVSNNNNEPFHTHTTHTDVYVYYMPERVDLFTRPSLTFILHCDADRVLDEGVSGVSKEIEGRRFE
jgi:hypothetical protein